MNRILLSVKDVLKINEFVDEHGLSEDDTFTLIEHSQSGIGSILEVEFKTGPKTKLVVEISGVEDW